MKYLKSLIASTLLFATLVASAAELGFVSGKWAGVSFTLTETSKGVWQDSNGAIRSDAHVNEVLNSTATGWGNGNFSEISGGFGTFDGAGQIFGKDGWILTEIAPGVWADSNGKMVNNEHAAAALTWEGSTGSMFTDIPSPVVINDEFRNGGFVTGVISSRTFILTEISEGKWKDNYGNFYGDWHAQTLLNREGSTGVMGYTDAELAQMDLDARIEEYNTAVVTSPWLSDEGSVYNTGTATDPVYVYNDYTGSYLQWYDNYYEIILIANNASDGDVFYTRGGDEIVYTDGKAIAVNDIKDLAGNIVFAQGEEVFLNYARAADTQHALPTIISSDVNTITNSGVGEAWSQGYSGAGITISNLSYIKGAYGDLVIGGTHRKTIFVDGEVIAELNYGIAKDAIVTYADQFQSIDLNADIIHVYHDGYDLSSLVTDALIVQNLGSRGGVTSHYGSEYDNLEKLVNSTLRDQSIIVGAIDMIDDPRTENFNEVTGKTRNLTLTSDYHYDGTYAYNYDTALYGNACGSVLMDRCVVDFSVGLDGKKHSGNASARVAGKAALLMQKFSDKSSSEIATLILSTATDIGNDGVDEVYGHGLVNLYKALTQ